MQGSCRVAAARVLWLEAELRASSSSDDVETLDDSMRVIEAAYDALERAALRAPQGAPLREAALRLAGARRTWLAIAADERFDGDPAEEQAFAELMRTSAALSSLLAADGPDGPTPSNVVSLVGRQPKSRRPRRGAC